MRIDTLHICGFRNLGEVRIAPSEGVNIFYGDNGAGKTNLLEALFVLCLGRSQRGAKDKDLITAETDTFRIEGSVFDGESVVEAAVACQRGGRKRVTLDGVVVRPPELFSRFCAVSLGPEDTDIIGGAPSMRRAFVDIYLSQLSRRHLSLLIDYQKILAQKNAALREELDASPFDELLVQTGARIVADRAAFLTELGRVAAAYYASISGGGQFNLAYEPSVALPHPDMALEEVQREFETQLARLKRREEGAGTALLGPHRDEVAVVIKGLPARTCASQGEWRSSVIALKLAVYQLLKERRRTPPVLVLDELFAELDPSRTEHLIACFGELGQLFLTTAVEPPDLLSARGRSFRIAHGHVEEVN